jgi:hypothetical protein
MRQLVPAAEQLSPTLVAFTNLAPEAKGFFEGFATVIARSTTGFPAFRKLLRDDFPPFLRAAEPFLRNLNPILTGLDLYKHEITAAMANVTAASNAVHIGATGDKVHYLRTLGPFFPESLATFTSRTSTNRNTAYSQPLSYGKLANGLLNFHISQCSGGPTAQLSTETPKNPAFSSRVEGEDAAKTEKNAISFYERLKKYALGGADNSANTPAPGCTLQGPFEPIYGSAPATAYQHTFEQGK